MLHIFCCLNNNLIDLSFKHPIQNVYIIQIKENPLFSKDFLLN